jgi:predicted metal-dependent hydrolase
MLGRALRERTPRLLRLDDGTVAVHVRESPRARTARLFVRSRGPVDLVVPRGTRDRHVDAFLRRNRDWIAGKVTEARAAAAQVPRLGLQRPDVVWLSGAALPLVRGNGRRSLAGRRDDTVLVHGPAEQQTAALERWYRREARARIGALAEQEAARLGLSFVSLGIRDQRSRWASCSRRGHLSFSWRLLLAPPAVLRYVVLHELMHLREPNHGPAFWRLVEAACPDRRTHARWLRQHALELHDYRPGASATELT